LEEDNTELNTVKKAIANEGGDDAGFNEGALVGPDLSRNAMGEAQAVVSSEGRGQRQLEHEWRLGPSETAVLP
jgi:hypothetical protein